MKKSFGEFTSAISDWTPTLKIATIVFAMIAIGSSAMTLFWEYTVPGLSPLAFGVTLLLLGIRELNAYFKENKSKESLILGIILILLFMFDLYLGIDQILSIITK